MKIGIDTPIYRIMEKIYMFLILNFILIIGFLGIVTFVLSLGMSFIYLQEVYYGKNIKIKEIFLKMKGKVLKLIISGLMYLIVIFILSYDTSIISQNFIILFIKILLIAHITSIFNIYIMKISLGNKDEIQLRDILQIAKENFILTIFNVALITAITMILKFSLIFVILPIVVVILVFYVYYPKINKYLK